MNQARDIEDALNPRMAGSTEGMTLQVLAQIRDSLSAQNRDNRSTLETITDVRERVIRLDESIRRFDVVVTTTKDHDAMIDAFVKDKDRRDGALGMLGMLRVWGPVVFSALAALWLFGRSFGITPAPPLSTPKVEQPRIDDAVGGRP